MSICIFACTYKISVYVFIYAKDETKIPLHSGLLIKTPDTCQMSQYSTLSSQQYIPHFMTDEAIIICVHYFSQLSLSIKLKFKQIIKAATNVRFVRIFVRILAFE